MNEELRYPIGRFVKPERVTEEAREQYIRDIESAPAALRKAVAGLTQAQLDTPYREGGWTVRRVVHHLVDSHMNAYIRFKLALTEDTPTIKPYDQALWSQTAETAIVPVESSLVLLEALHTRWTALMRALPPEAFERKYVHPESGPASLRNLLALYSWHGRHHTAHITALRERMRW